MGAFDPAGCAESIAAALTPQTRLVAFVAMPAAGKSPIATALADLVPQAQVISANAIRRELGRGTRQSFSRIVFSIAFDRLAEAVDAGRTAIWDASNKDAADRERLLAAVDRPGVETLAVLLRVPLAAAESRNKRRSRPLPQQALKLMHGALAQVTTDELLREGFTRAIELRP